MSNARNLSKFKPSSSGLVETADIADDGITNAKIADDAIDTAQIADDAVSTDQIANDAVISTSGAITTTGAFTSVGIDDNADGVAMTIDANEDVELNNGGLYVTGSLNSLTVDKGGIDRSGNTTRIISGRSGGNYSDFSINIAGTGNAVNRQVYIDYQGNMTLDNGNLTIGTSGKGIDFSATGDGFAAAGSELLDDYEEGAYTLSFNGFANQTVSQGWYTKVGRLCYVTTFIHASGSQNTNSFTCSLPFTAAAHSASNNSGYYIGSIGPTMHYRVDTGSAGMVTYVAAGTATFRLYEVNADGDWHFMQNNAFTSEDQAWVAFTYVTAS